MLFISFQNQNSPNFGSYKHAKGLKLLIKGVYPRCALTGIKYGSGLGTKMTTDHVVARHLKGPNRKYNYLFILSKINTLKGCKSLKTVLRNNPIYTENLFNYYKNLLESRNPKVKDYATKSLNFIMEELTSLSLEVQNKFLKLLSK